MHTLGFVFSFFNFIFLATVFIGFDDYASVVIVRIQ